MKRFVSLPRTSAEAARVKSELKADGRLYDGLLSCACERLEEAGEAHFALEGIYGECMDFASESRFCSSLAATVADLLENEDRNGK
jgi:hypothetical protein